MFSPLGTIVFLNLSLIDFFLDNIENIFLSGLDFLFLDDIRNILFLCLDVHSSGDHCAELLDPFGLTHLCSIKSIDYYCVVFMFSICICIFLVFAFVS